MGEVSSDTAEKIGKRLVDALVEQCADLGGSPAEFRRHMVAAMMVLQDRVGAETAASMESEGVSAKMWACGNLRSGHGYYEYELDVEEDARTTTCPRCGHVDQLYMVNPLALIGAPATDILALYDPEDMEVLAAAEHESWSGWMRWMLKSMEQDSVGGGFLAQHIPSGWPQARFMKMVKALPCMQRWRRQMKTSYVDLSEKEKESDRKEAREKMKVYRP